MIRESEQQANRRDAVWTFFATKTLKQSSIGKPRQAPGPRPVLQPQQGSKTVNQANGGTVKVQDCEGTDLFEMKGIKGISGEQILRAGCDDSSSGSS